MKWMDGRTRFGGVELAFSLDLLVILALCWNAIPPFSEVDHLVNLIGQKVKSNIHYHTRVSLSGN